MCFIRPIKFLALMFSQRAAVRYKTQDFRQAEVLSKRQPLYAVGGVLL